MARASISCAWPLLPRPNPDKPPFYLDMPFAIVDGEAQIVPEVADKIIAADPVHDLERYLHQPVAVECNHDLPR